MMISGHVQAWVKDHCNGQKTDLNDAFAILNLAYDAADAHPREDA